METRRASVFALATYIGTIMGVGLFGLPYVAAQAGFGLVVLYLLLGGAIALMVNRMFASVAVHTQGHHRLPGYAAQYLGSWGKPSAFLVQILGLYGALLGYLIVGGQFLAGLLGGSVILYTFIFFIFGALIIWRGTSSIGPVELILLFIFFAIIILLFVSGASHINHDNFKVIDWTHFFVPYGVVLFSLWGASIIPEIREQLQGDFKKIGRVIVWGLIICAAVYLAFTYLILGVSGSETTSDAISGLQRVLGTNVLKIGYIFGLITTFTSFITLGLTIQKLFWYDYRIPKFRSWMLAVFVPLVVFVLGLQDFISVIGMTGAITLGLDGVLVTLIFLQLKKRQQSPRLSSYRLLGSALIGLLLLGVALELFYSIKGF
ncbi:MAG: aromatic amino acid transport family protein [Patescibacteria group bacterium]